MGSGELSSSSCAHSEVKLSVVTYLTNSIVDEILQELYHSHKSLVRLLSLHQAQGGPLPHPTSAHLPPPTLPIKILGGGQPPWDLDLPCSHLSFPRPDTWPS